MKILLLSPDLKMPGGVAQYCEMLLDSLDSAITVRHVTTGSRTARTTLLTRFWTAVKDGVVIIRLLRGNGYDVVHLHTSLKRFAIHRDMFFLLVLRLNGYLHRTILHIHGWDNETSKRIYRNPLRRRIVVFLLNNTARIIVLSSEFENQLKMIGIDPRRIVVKTTMYSKIATRSRLRSGRKILFMSRFVREKGLYVAAEVALLLKQSGIRNWSMIFAGDGDEMEGLRTFIKDKGLLAETEITGYIQGVKKEDILTSSDIFLFPTSYGEGCPIVVLEAMGTGLSIVSTRVGAIPEVVTHGVNGFLHEVPDAQLFFQSVRELLMNDKLLEEFRSVNIAKAEACFERSAVTREIEQIYFEVADGR